MSLIIGFDTEYTRCALESDLPEPDGRRNRVLSYQLYFLDPRTGREGPLLIPIENGDKLTGRLALGSLLGKALPFAKREGIIDAIPDRIILAAHFWRTFIPALTRLDAVVDRARAAVEAYQKENPDWFKTGTDFITKSLGFADPKFRAKHGFASRTRTAFDKFQSLVTE